MTLRHELLVAAERFKPAAFDATDALELIEQQTQRRWERGTVAKEITRAVRDGQLQLTGRRSRGGQVLTNHYRLMEGTNDGTN